MVLKILLMGLNSAGKTTIIRHVLEGKEFEDLENLSPTEGIKTDEYRYRRLVEISVFDAGGQKQFLEGYFTAGMERTIFSNVRIFFWVVDVADKEKLSESRSWFSKAYASLKEFSPNCKIYILAHKYDIKKRISKTELKKFFSKLGTLENVTYYTSSVKTKTSRRIIGRILNRLIEKTETERMKSLQKYLDRLNKKLKANLTLLVNKDDGLEIASSISDELQPKIQTKETHEFLRYLSIKTLIYPIKVAKQLFKQFKQHKFLVSKALKTTIFKCDAEYIIVKDIHKLISIFIIAPISTVSLDKYERDTSKIAPELLKILKLK